MVALYWLLNFLFTYWFISDVLPTLQRRQAGAQGGAVAAKRGKRRGTCAAALQRGHPACCSAGHGALGRSGLPSVWGHGAPLRTEGVAISGGTASNTQPLTRYLLE